MRPATRFNGTSWDRHTGGSNTPAGKNRPAPISLTRRKSRGQSQQLHPTKETREMPDRNGFRTPEETRQEFVDAEAALKARRDPYQLAGELTPDEAKATADADARLAVAVAANQAAQRAVTKAQEAVKEPWKGTTLKEDEA